MYQQPDFYHFSDDSVALAKYCAVMMKQTKNIKVLDLCAGCGVVGIEFSLVHKSIGMLTFLEAEQSFNFFLQKNIMNFIPYIKNHIIISSLVTWNFPQKFDLVISNPPYFLEGEGRNSSDPKRNNCHFMTEELFKCLFVVARNSLSVGGSFYFTGRRDQRIIKNYCDLGIIKEEKSLGKSSIFSLIHN